jgi:hypothetical protein
MFKQPCESFLRRFEEDLLTGGFDRHGVAIAAGITLAAMGFVKFVGIHAACCLAVSFEIVVDIPDADVVDFVETSVVLDDFHGVESFRVGALPPGDGDSSIRRRVALV